MIMIPWLAEYARRLTLGLRVVWQELETRVADMIAQGCPYPPDVIAEGTSRALISWEMERE